MTEPTSATSTATRGPQVIAQMASLGLDSSGPADGTAIRFSLTGSGLVLLKGLASGPDTFSDEGSGDSRGMHLSLKRSSLAAGRQPLASTPAWRYSFYSPEMNLLSETELRTTPGSPQALYEYIWFNGHPVAQVDAGLVTHWTFTDHLGTPILQTTSAGNTYWQAEYEPYGKVLALRTLDQHQPLRLPGQEAEQLNLGPNGTTERSYNIFRWYRDGWGRYTQVDPAFDDRGGNTFAYAGDNPLLFVDPLGQAVRTVGYDPGTKAKITRAAEDADAASQTCLDCPDRGPFRKLVRSLTITCLPYSLTERTGATFCGRPSPSDRLPRPTPPFPNGIDLTPIGIGETTNCGCLKGTILHEVLHLLGPAYGDSPGSSKNAYDTARRCFTCAGPSPFRFSTGVDVH